MRNKSYIFNINDIVIVQLTSKGLEVLKDEYSGNPFVREIPGLNENVLTTSLWRLMNIFGRDSYNGGDQLFENNIIALEKSN